MGGSNGLNGVNGESSNMSRIGGLAAESFGTGLVHAGAGSASSNGQAQGQRRGDFEDRVPTRTLVASDGQPGLLNEHAMSRGRADDGGGVGGSSTLGPSKARAIAPMVNAPRPPVPTAFGEPSLGGPPRPPVLGGGGRLPSLGGMVSRPLPPLGSTGPPPPPTLGLGGRANINITETL